jgi:uncharacterized protein (TIGR04255 family)
MAMPTPTSPYPRPPITEAVFAFHFANHLDRRVIERFARANRKQFPAQEQMYDISIDTTRPAEARARPIGFKVTEAEKALIVIIRPETIAIARLPPYKSWEDLLSNAKDVWDTLKKLAGHPQLSRLSTRYINRLDIKLTSAVPNVPGTTSVNLADYLKFGITIPPDLLTFPLTNFHITCGFASDPSHEKFQHTITVASIPSPLIDHAAFMLDIDVATIEPIPMREEQMWAIAEALRRRKNQLFEASVTDTARRLFV